MRRVIGDLVQQWYDRVFEEMSKEIGHVIEYADSFALWTPYGFRMRRRLDYVGGCDQRK